MTTIDIGEEGERSGNIAVSAANDPPMVVIHFVSMKFWLGFSPQEAKTLATDILTVAKRFEQ